MRTYLIVLDNLFNRKFAISIPLDELGYVFRRQRVALKTAAN